MKSGEGRSTKSQDGGRGGGAEDKSPGVQPTRLPLHQCPGHHPTPLAASGGFSAGTKPVMWVLIIIRDMIPCDENPCHPRHACVKSNGHLGVRLVTHQAWAPRRQGQWDSPLPTFSGRYTTNTTVSNALMIYFWGNCFLNIVEYTGSLQGNNTFKTLFFLRKGLVYLLCSVFLNNLWTREAPLIRPSLSLPCCEVGLKWDPQPLSRSPHGELLRGFSVLLLWFLVP